MSDNPLDPDDALKASRSLRIAWLLQGDEGFGVARAVQSLSEQLHRMGHRPVYVCCKNGAMVELGQRLGFEVICLGLGGVPKLGGGLFAKARGFFRLNQYKRRWLIEAERQLAGKRIDLVQCLWPNFVALAGGLAERLGAQAVWEMPNIVSQSLWGLNQRYYLSTCQRYNIHVLANSAYTASTLGQRNGVKIDVMHLGADPEIFDPVRVQTIPRQSLGIPDSAVVFGIIARLEASKGADRFLSAMLRVVASDAVDLHLVLLGGPTDGDYAQSLRAQAETSGQGHRLHMVGRVDNPQCYYHLMDIAVNSRVDPEPFGLSVIEAMMMGVPVLVHALGGPAETVEDGRTGWQVQAATVDAFEAGIRRVMSERNDWPRYAATARGAATQRFSVESQARFYLSAIAQDLSR